MDREQLDELRELIAFLKANEIAEFDLEQSDLKVRIKFSGAISSGQMTEGLANLERLVAANAHAPVQPSSLSAASATSAVSEELTSEPSLHEVKSPIVGTFYESPAPGSPAFVKVGDQVESGQVLCIIEAMKLMNEIEADVAGEIVKRIAVSGQPVEYGQALFSIRPR